MLSISVLETISKHDRLLMVLTRNQSTGVVTIGVLALQGGFAEHLALLRRASQLLDSEHSIFLIEVRDAAALAKCDALVIPGGESTTMALVASHLGLLGPLRKFVKYPKPPASQMLFTKF